MAYSLHGCENKLAQHQSDNESRFPLSVRVPQSLSVAERLCRHLVSKLIKSFGRSILRRVCPGLVGDKAVAFETKSPRATPNSVEEAGLRSNRHCSLCFVERLVAMSSYAFLFCIQFLFMTCDDPRPIQPSSLPKLWRQKALVISSLSSAAILGAHIRG